MRIGVREIEALIESQRVKLLIIMSLGVILLVIRDVPFLNIFFPQNTIFSVIFTASVILFGFYRKILFFLVFTILTIFLNFAKLTLQAEQAAILVFVILSILTLDEFISFLRNR